MSLFMSKAQRTKQFIIERTAPVFNVKGYEGTSLADITRATGLTKGSIYGNFGNKDEVALAAYHHSTGSLRKRVELAASGKTSATEKLLGITEFYRKNWKGIFGTGGCPFLNAAIEADDNLPYLRSEVQSSFRQWALKFCKIMEEGKRKGEFGRDIVSINYAYLFITLLEGGIMLGKISNNPKHLFAALDRITLIIHEELKK